MLSTLTPLLPLLTLLGAGAQAAILSRQNSSVPTPGTIQWGPCGDPSQVPASVECGKLVVPLDYNNPPSPDDYNANNTVTLGMSRLRAPGSDNSTRESLIVNPGGPGGVAWVTLVLQAARKSAGAENGIVSKAIREKYDLIGLDPRGVGLSQNIQCKRSLKDSKPNIVLNTQEDWDKLTDWNKQFAESCHELSGDIVKFVDTMSALGEDKLNLVALSYGTTIAGQYINLYPENVGRIVMDGVVDHTQDTLHACGTDSATFEPALDAYFAYCDSTPECASQFQSNGTTNGTDTFSTAQIFDGVLDKLLQSPLPAAGCQADNATCQPQVGLRDFISIVQTGLQVQEPNPVFPTSWLNLTTNLASAYKGDGTPFSPPRVADGAPYDPTVSLDAGTAIYCLDFGIDQSFSGLQRQRLGLGALHPHTRGYSNEEVQALNCLGWPYAPSNPPKPLDVAQTNKSAEVLIVQSTLDPSTSVEWALSVKQQVPNSRFVLRDGVGHTSYILFGETSQVIDRYLVNGTLPDENLVTKS